MMTVTVSSVNYWNFNTINLIAFRAPIYWATALFNSLKSDFSLASRVSAASKLFFKSATTTQDRQALLDQVITAWANTSSLGDAKASNPISTPSPALLSSSSGSWYVGSPAQAIADFAAKQPALYAQLSALERFNGQSVIERYTRATNSSYYDAATGTYKGYTFYTVSIEPQRLPFFQTAYDSLKASTYQSLYLQTEGKQLLDQIELVIDDKGLRLDFAAVNSALARKVTTDPSQAATDLAEFISFTTDSLASSGWDGAAQLGEWGNTNLRKFNTTGACKRRPCTTKSRAACARIYWARARKVSGKNLQISRK